MLESWAVNTSARTKLAILMAFHLLWGLVLWFSISKYGMGVSTDSVDFLFAGQNLAQGHGLITHDGAPVILWPPLYPLLLAALRVGFGLDVFAAAHVLQVTAFLGLALCLSLLFLKIFPESFLLALAANVLSEVGAVVLSGFMMVGSDYLFLFLTILFVLLTGYYLDHQSPRMFVMMAAVGMCAMLMRYLGIAVIAVGIVSVVLFARGELRQRLLRGLFMALAAVPAVVWLVITSRFVGRRAPDTFTENFNWFSKSVLEWFLPFQVVKTHAASWTPLLWVVLSILTAVLLLASIRRKVFTAFNLPILLLGLSYLGALFVSASIAYYNKLGGRFLLPLYIPSISLLLISGNTVIQSTRHVRPPEVYRTASLGLLGVLVVIFALLSRITWPLILQSHVDGAADGENVFNTAAWQANDALQFWNNRPPGDYRLFSNEPDGVAFSTRHECEASPRRFSGPYGQVEFPVKQYAAQLFPPGTREIYLIWIEPNPYDYYYGVKALSAIAIVEPLFRGEGGGVYRLRPRAGAIQP